MLHSLRKKSEHTRMMITIGVALVITLIVAVFWIWSISGRFAKSKETIKDDVRPFAVFKDSVSDLFQDYKDTRAEYKEDQEVTRQAVEDYIIEQELSKEDSNETVPENTESVEIVEAVENVVDEPEIVGDDTTSSTE